MGMGVASSGRRRGRRTRRAAMAEINVTPLVDVMLVLLIIFMVTVTLPAVGVPIELPESRANAVEETPTQVNISIGRDGRIFVENEAVPNGAFPDALAAIDRNADGELPTIVLRGDRSINYGRVMAVMGELSRAGFTSITQVTDSSDSAP
ncbi:biopolymer transporter ExbD [uncultured Erythrobacter sp.]|uniref:biopolymer transporter ExbD n=1 Tax=uncultured Erythrobacter sp. TaxID=263913 RepID=UPI002633CF8C|nr:biopolymer transporter ExbD [uncultured Erythrobacter sp.]